MKTVLYLQSSLNEQNLCELAGVREFSRTKEWHLVVRLVGAAASEKRAGLVAKNPAKISEIVDEVAPDGIVVEGGALSIQYKLTDFQGVPVVFMDRCNLLDKKNIICIRSDSKRIAAAAFDELVRFEYPNYAFVPWIRPLEWSKSRAAAFEKLVMKSGAKFHPFPPYTKGGAGDSFEEFVSKVRQFLLDLPRPCGIFAANDVIGECVLEGLVVAGRHVPNDFVVVGVDNDSSVCENTKPSLSSVRLDFNRAGICAGEMLAVRMRGAKPKEIPTFGVAEVIHRLSTRKFARQDPRIAAAIEYIREHVSENLRVSDIVKCMKCSRRLAELRFREVTGNTILSCIRKERRLLAERLLRETDCPIRDIARACGYTTTDSFRKDFLTQTGKSPRNFRLEALRNILDI